MNMTLDQFIEESQQDIDDCRDPQGDTHVFHSRLDIALQHLRELMELGSELTTKLGLLSVAYAELVQRNLSLTDDRDVLIRNLAEIRAEVDRAYKTVARGIEIAPPSPIVLEADTVALLADRDALARRVAELEVELKKWNDRHLEDMSYHGGNHASKLTVEDAVTRIGPNESLIPKEPKP